MDLSKDSDSSDSQSSAGKTSDVKPKNAKATSQPSHRSDKYSRLDERSSGSSKELERYRGDKDKESSSRDRVAEKSRDKADKYRNRDKDRERARDRDRERYSRDKGRSRSEKDEKHSRHRDNRRDRNERTDQRRSDSKTRSKSRSRSREAPTRSHQHDRTAIKEPPKSLVSLQLPQMPLPAATVSAIKKVEPITAINNFIATAIPTSVAPPNLISPLLASARYTEQMQKRKLLWGNKKVEGEQQQTTNNRWEQTKFSQDSDGKMATKFLRLMGMKDVPKTAEDPTPKGNAPDSIKNQTEMLSTMEHQYEVARQMTHTMRGMGLGFG